MEVVNEAITAGLTPDHPKWPIAGLQEWGEDEWAEDEGAEEEQGANCSGVRSRRARRRAKTRGQGQREKYGGEQETLTKLAARMRSEDEVYFEVILSRS